MADPQPTVPSIVLDSNVALDWLVFDDPAIRAIAAAITHRQVRWIATSAMAQELEHVLTFQKVKSRRFDPVQVMSRWQALVQTVEPSPSAPLGAPRCTDPDDQKFIDLALVAGACALLSRDRAVLALAGAARRWGVHILKPAAWPPSVPGELAQ